MLLIMEYQCLSPREEQSDYTAEHYQLQTDSAKMQQRIGLSFQPLSDCTTPPPSLLYINTALPHSSTLCLYVRFNHCTITDSTSWLTGLEPDMVFSLKVLMCCAFGDAFLITTIVQSGCLSYCSLPVSSNQSGHSPLIFSHQ